MSTEIAQRAVGIRCSASNPTAIGLMLVVLFFGIPEGNSLKAAESYSLRGAYTLSNFDGARENPEGKKLSEYQCRLCFRQKRRELASGNIRRILRLSLETNKVAV